MLTARGWWVLLTVAAFALVGVAVAGAWSAAVPLVGLALLAWFLAEWAAFAYRFRGTSDRLAVARVVVQGGREVPAVWSRTSFAVRVTVSATAGPGFRFAVADDRPAADLPAPAAPPRAAGPLIPGSPLVVEYEVRADAPGLVRFEGVQVRVADQAGLFYRRLFIRHPVEVPVLPPLTDADGRRRGGKRFNTLPPPGQHRFRRPGSGSELLDLRDYHPGDPPKMIAWRPSARRDALITRELESDVPVRCVVFLDASDATRVGPPGDTPLARLAAVAAGIAQAAAGTRDLVGLTVFDDDATHDLPPARTHAHLIRLTRTLAEAAGRLPARPVNDPNALGRYAAPVARELYPDLCAADLNGRPIGLYWLPLSDSRLFAPVLALLFAPFLLTRKPVLEQAAKLADAVAPGRSWQVLVAMVVVPGLVAWLVWVFHGIRGFLSPRGPRTLRRKQLAAVYAALDRAGPGTVERYLTDDAAFADRTGRFLLTHRVRVPVPLYDPTGRPAGRGADKVAVLARAVLRCVGRARDNELFVLLADLVDLSADLRPLADAVRVARARHHQVLVLVPLPDGTPTDPPALADGLVSVDALVGADLARRLRDGYERLRAELAAAGAVVARLGDGDPVRHALDRIDRLRGVRLRR